MDSAPVSAPVSAPASTPTQTSTPAQAHTPSQASPPSGGDSKPVSSSPEMFEVKVNGKMVRMTRDEVLGHASMSHAAQSKFEEAAQTRKQVEKIINTARSNPIEALMDPALGLTKQQIKDAFESWYTSEFIEPETLNADQRARREVEAKLKKYEDADKEREAASRAEQEEKLTSQQREFLQGQIIDAIDKSGLPKTKFIASRMAFYMRENLRQGWEAPIDMIVQQVKKERQSIMSDLVDSSEGDVLINMLGEGVVNKIRQHDLKQLRARRQTPSTNGGVGVVSEGQTEKVSYSDVNRNLRNLRAKGF